MPRLDLVILEKIGIVMMLTISGSLSFTLSYSSSIWAIDPHVEDFSEAFKKSLGETGKTFGNLPIV